MFRAFYTQLNEEQRSRLAEISGTTTRYIETHLIAPPARRKVPNKPLMDRLAVACGELGADISKEQLVSYFYETPDAPQEPKEAAA